MNFYLTNAGLAAFVNPANTGTNAILIDRIGVSSVALPGDPTSHAGLLALPNELKRLSTFAGASVGDNTIHVTIRDESADTYALRTFGLYASTGVLMAYVTSADPISQKTPSSMTLIAADLAFVVAINAQVNFGNTNFLNPPATTVTPGVVELATKEETAEGVDPTRAVTPYGLKWALDQLLAGYAALVHNHDAAAIVSGVLNVGRIPALGMEKITGLASALAGKSDTGHTHAAGDIVSGVLNVLRIPDLTMAKITDLAAALALKLDGAAFTWNNLPGKPAVVVSDTDAVLRTLQVRMAAPANGSIYFGDQAVGSRRLDFTGDLFKFIGAGLTINGYTPWTNQNFNPADKAAAIHSHDWAQVTGKPDLVINLQASISARGSAGNGSASLVGGDANNSGFVGFFLPDGTRVGYIGAASAAGKAIVFAAENGGSFFFGARPSFNGAIPWDSANLVPDTAATANSVIKRDAGGNATLRDLTATRGNSQGYVFLGDQSGGGRWLGYDGVNYTLVNANLAVNGSIVWTAATFNPASKANVSHTHTTADITDLLDKFWPAGELRYYAKNAVPSGVRVLAANGAAVSRTTYARLYAEIGTTFGAGDGATTFNLPDLRGVFIRGLDQGRGLDAGRALGALQMSQNLAHTHSYLLQQGVDNTQAGSGVQGGSAHGGEVTGSSGGSEARPINQALLACITY